MNFVLLKIFHFYIGGYYTYFTFLIWMNFSNTLIPPLRNT